MSDPYIGEIRPFGFCFAPQNWSLCAGQILPITQNTALYAIIGRMYGETDANSFMLPNLQGRIPAHQGKALDGHELYCGQRIGTEGVTLMPWQIPQHSHPVFTASGTGTQLAGGKPSPTSMPSHPVVKTGASPPFENYNAYRPISGSSFGVLHPCLSVEGGGGQHENRQPFLTINFCISLNGAYPVRS